MNRSGPRFLAMLGVAVCVLLFAVSGYAQFQTGNIYGRAQAKDGSVLPGVTVTLTGVGAPQTQVTDASGNFRFLNLSPGTYTVKAELSGYGSAIRAGIGVRVAQNADVTLTLNPSVSESITVTAEAPLLDVRKAGTSTNVSKVELEKIPTSRDPWTVLQSVPSVMVDRINVGGTQSGQQSNYIAKGALGRDNSWNVDGVNITDMGATGSSPTYYDFDSFEEMQVTTGGSDPRIQTPGVQLNMVTKRGTNDFRGSGRYFYTPESLSAEATVPEDQSSFLVRTNGVHYVRDYGAEIGGPIWRDHLWFWGARADQKISQWQSQQKNATVNAGVVTLTPAFIIPDDTILRNKNLKLNAQILPSNSAVGFYTFGDKFRNARDLSPTRPFETAYTQTGPTKVYKLEDTQIIGSSLYLTGMWSKVQGGFGLFANGGRGESAPSRWVDAQGVNHDNYFTYETVRPQKQYRLDGSKFFDLGGMNHELKFGFGYRHTPVNSQSGLPGPAHGFMSYAVTQASATSNQNLCINNGLPSGCFTATLPRDVSVGYDEKYRDFYLGDTILMGNLTIQAGLRLDRQRTSNFPQSIAANPVLATPLTLPRLNGTNLTAQLPAISYPGDPEELEWNSLSPRIGMTYSLGADKRTLLRAGYNRYVSQLGSAVSGANPLAYSAFYFYGFDTNGDHTIQRNELLKFRSSAFTGVDPTNPSGISFTRRVDYDMEVPHSDEILIGGEREILTDFSVGVTYTWRKSHNLFATLFEKTQGKGDYYGPADFVPATRNGAPVVAGGVFNLCPNGLTFITTTNDCRTSASAASGVAPIDTFTTSTVPVYMLASGVPTPTYRVLTTRPEYSQKFSGWEVTATKRLSNRWMLRGSFSLNDYTEDCGDGALANPTGALPATTVGSAGPGACPGGQYAPQSAGSGAFSNDFINSRWQFNMTGLWVAPWDINIGASLTGRQGYAAVLREAVTGLPPGTVNVVLDPIGDVRFDNVYELDLRIAKDFRIANRIGFTVSGDLFNVPNKRTELQRETLILQNANGGAGGSRSAGWRVTELQAPRVWRLGGKITF
jgi:Carboxypeptidase regulatory-like domain/TonB-dependent Receptor Plug Domain